MKNIRNRKVFPVRGYKADSQTDSVELTTDLTEQEMQMLEIVANDMLSVDEAAPEDAGGDAVLNKLVKDGFVDKYDLYYSLTDKGELALNESVETAEDDEPEAEKAESNDQVIQFMNIAEEVDELTTTLLGTLDTFEEKMNSARQIAKSLGNNEIASSINQALEDFRSAIKASVDGLTDEYVVPARNNWIDELEAAKPTQKAYESPSDHPEGADDLEILQKDYWNALSGSHEMEDRFNMSADQGTFEDLPEDATEDEINSYYKDWQLNELEYVAKDLKPVLEELVNTLKEEDQEDTDVKTAYDLAVKLNNQSDEKLIQSLVKHGDEVYADDYDKLNESLLRLTNQI